MGVSTWFQSFCSNIKFDNTDLENLRYRYKQITKRINKDYWGRESEVLHSLYVGSYGRETAIHLSDIDMLAVLPYEKYQQYQKYSVNGQSALIQDVKISLQKTYSTSHIRGDGQVVKIDFSDGINFEILPAFINTNESYTYPDTTSGGSWKVTDPKAEISQINICNKNANGNLKRLCKMIREWKDNRNVDINGYTIDTFVYNFIKGWENKDKGYVYYDWMTRDFLKYLSEQKESGYLYAPGSNRMFYYSATFKAKAQKAYEKAKEAIADEEKYPSCAKSEWREIYGDKFPN